MELTNFQKRLVDEACATRGAGKLAVQSALRHLERAWLLIESMPEVAIFLGITAEEESATAVFRALQKRQYRRAKELNPYSHVHKSGLTPFLQAIGNLFLPLIKEERLQLIFEDQPGKTSGKLKTRVILEKRGGQTFYVDPIPPLGNVGVKADGSPEDYQVQLDKLASKKGHKNILDYIRKLANDRNEMLYASAHKLMHAKNAPDIVLRKQSIVMSHLATYLLIEQNKEIQHMVQSALETFLDIVVNVKPGEK